MQRIAHNVHCILSVLRCLSPIFTRLAAALAIILLFCLHADAQIVTPHEETPFSTVIPTDVVPLPGTEQGQLFGENFQMQLLQKLPAKFYFNGSAESSFRYETNVFQTATNAQRDTVFRITPNITAGWALNSRTRIYTNYFFLRDSLFHHIQLNTNINSYGWGIQRDIPLGKRLSMQLDVQGRELWQTSNKPVFDYLPTVSISYPLTPRTVTYASVLLQMRGLHPFVAPDRELDPFYSFGLTSQQGPWTFSNTATFVQNFRSMFGAQALVRQNNYSWVLDFEIARRITKKVPGLVAFVRAEPIFNFHSAAAPGLSGTDFRLYYGLRMTFAKPALTPTLEQIQNRLKQEQTAPPVSVPPAPSEPAPENTAPQQGNDLPPQSNAAPLPGKSGLLPVNTVPPPPPCLQADAVPPANTN